MNTQSPDRRSMLLLIVLSGIIISLCMGLRQSLGLFMQPMGADLGITAGAFGFSIALQNIVWGVSQPFAGALADRYGPRPVIVVTALLFSAGLLMLARHDGARAVRKPDCAKRCARRSATAASFS
jgi:MFS family permease